MQVLTATGSGSVTRTASTVVVLGAEVPEGIRAQCLDAASSISRGTVGGLSRSLLHVLLPILDGPVTVAAAALTDAGVELLLVGTGQARWAQEDADTALHAASGGAFVTWIVAGDVERIVLGIDGATYLGDEAFATEIYNGTISGSAAVLQMDHSVDAERATPPPAAEAEVLEPHMPTSSFEVISLDPDGDDEPGAREPLPVAAPAPAGNDADVLVDAIQCRVGHPNHPRAKYCAVCGRGIAQGESIVLLQLPRPPLGVLVTDDGSVFALDRGYVIGRSPEDDPAVLAGGSLPLVLESESREHPTMSRVHAEVQLDGWDVKLVDRGSANGTFVRPRSETDWSRLDKEMSVVVEPGSTVALGGRTLVYESHHLGPRRT